MIVPGDIPIRTPAEQQGTLSLTQHPLSATGPAAAHPARQSDLSIPMEITGATFIMDGRLWRFLKKTRSGAC